jgi:GNAT superfamily N-acetyltransferase
VVARTFRPVPADASPAVELLEEYFAERSASFPAAQGVYRPARPAASVFDDGVFLVLELDGVPSGVGGIRRLPDPEPGARRYEVKHVWVRPEARGAGSGRALLEELEQRARDLGATELVLDTNRVLEAAGALYSKTGYVSVEPYNDNPNATDWYRKALG